MALGIFEGHAARMADGFRAIREAELELSGQYRPELHDEELARFNWEQFNDEEWALCPPVVSMGGDGAMYDIGFQNLSRLMMSGKPIKVVVLDTQVYSNTGGQACTSGFLGQISDMAQYGKAMQGKKEVRKEIGLIAMAHRTTYVMQSTIAHPSHLIEGFVQGLKARRPALFNVYAACQPEHGIGDDRGAEQARLAVESRAYPLFRYDPGRGATPRECLDLSGNPALDEDLATYSLRYREYGREKSLDVPMTFADFALTEGRFRKHFRTAPADTYNDSMLPLADYLNASDEEREGKLPYVWSVNREGKLGRLMVDQAMVASSEDRIAFWRVLCSLAGHTEARAESQSALEARLRAEIAGQLSARILELAGLGAGGATSPGGDGAGRGGGSSGPASGGLGSGAANGAANARARAGVAASDGAPAGPARRPAERPSSYEAPFVESEQCTSCDECIKAFPRIFAYDENKHAYVKDPGAADYVDLVRAAERCTAGVIHPGLPKDPEAPGMSRLIERARPFN